jgi:DNA-binding transcriptional LysR family regulator
MMEFMELRHLRYFVAVAEELHFTRAAEKLLVAQPALSQQIRDLEQEIGVTLLYRTNRKVELTHAGAVFLDEARQVISQSQQAISRAIQAQRGYFGRLSIGHVLSATGAKLTDAIRAFSTEHPNVDLVLNDLGETEQWSQLADEKIDIALTRTACGHESILKIPFERSRLSVLMPVQHPLAHRKRVSLKQFSNERFIIGRDSDFPSYNQFLRTQCRQSGFELTVRQQVRDLASILWMVSAGIGLGFGATGLDCLSRPDVISIPIYPTIQTTIWMQWRKSDCSPVLKHFFSAAARAKR